MVPRIYVSELINDQLRIELRLGSIKIKREIPWRGHLDTATGKSRPDRRHEHRTINPQPIPHSALRI